MLVQERYYLRGQICLSFVPLLEFSSALGEVYRLESVCFSILAPLTSIAD